MRPAALAPSLLDAVRRYQQLGHWWCDLFLLMPDHVHGLIRFPCEAVMAKVVGNWKRGVARFQGVCWQENFFDHRIRHAAERQEKWWYIRRNPVVKGLCAQEQDWPWWWAAGADDEEAR